MCAIKTLCFTKNSPGYFCSSGTKTKGLDCKTLVPVVKSRLGHDVKSSRSRLARPGGATQGWQHPPKVSWESYKNYKNHKKVITGGFKDLRVACYIRTCATNLRKFRLRNGSETSDIRTRSQSNSSVKS